MAAAAAVVFCFLEPLPVVIKQDNMFALVTDDVRNAVKVSFRFGNYK